MIGVELRYTLVSEGSSDIALLPILDWLLQECLPHRAIQPQWADLRSLPQPPRSLSDKVLRAYQLFPCDLIFVHRDADNEPYIQRRQEIEAALVVAAQHWRGIPPAICVVVPIRMQETWLLIEEAAIRRAAGNPNGREPLRLPQLTQLENVSDPKQVLYDVLRRASGLSGRRLRAFQERRAAVRIADYIDDFTLLRRLSAFRLLEQQIEQIVLDHNLRTGGQ